MFRGTYIYSSSFIYYSLRVCYELTTNTIIVHSSLCGPALDFTTKSSIDRIKDQENDPFLGVLEKNKLLVVSMQIRFKTLTCKFKSQLDGDVTLEPGS